MRRGNPDPVDVSTRLQQFLVFTGQAHRFGPKDLAEAAVAVGVPPDAVSDFEDSLASWL
jgi:hypothetical protein